MMGDNLFSALYQGSPKTKEGLKCKRDYFQILDKEPEGVRWVRYWDLATSQSREADFTSSHRVGLLGGDLVITSEVRGRCGMA